MRPTMFTLVISAVTRPQPPNAKLPICIRCQSLAVPSVELYWHIGETVARFGKVSPRIVNGENKALAIERSFRWEMQTGGDHSRPLGAVKASERQLFIGG